MTEQELDALLATAKPHPLPHAFGNENFAWQRWGGEPVPIPEPIFNLLKCDRFDKFNKIYTTETAAMDALRAAVAYYRAMSQ